MSVRIELLGTFRVEIDGAAIPDDAWRQRRPAELVQLLALAPGRRMPRAAVIEALWPDLDPRAGAANLHKAAHFARRTLECDDAVVLAVEHVALWPDRGVVIDAERFTAAARRALRVGAAAACVAAAQLYAGDLLPAARDRFTEQREELRATHRQLLRAARRWEELAETEPGDEQAARELMRGCLDAEDTDGALRRYRQLWAALEELDLRPSTRTNELYEQALGAHAPTRLPPHRGPLLGRDEPLRAARRLLRAADAGEGGTLLVEGPPGIGKTRFALALADEAADAGWAVVRTAASDTDGPVPYAPVATAVRRLVAARPDVLALLPSAPRTALSALMSGAEPASRAELYPAVAQLLVTAAGAGATLLLLDDAHLADDATLELVAHLTSRARFAPVVLVLTVRPHQLPPALGRLTAGLLARRIAIRLRLPPLGSDDVAALARRAAHCEPSPAALETVRRLCEGNPLFIEELAAAIAADGTVPEVVDIPAAVTARLSGLGPADRDRLQRVAVAGGAFATGDLAAMLGRGIVAGLLDRAIAQDVLTMHDGAVEFRHALVREALLREVPEHRRTQIHDQVARQLVRAGAPAARIAHHAAIAGRDDAARWLRRAAEQALRSDAYTDALGFTDHGLALAGSAERQPLLELRADALHALGDPAASLAYRLALEAATPSSAPPLRVKLARAYLAVGQIDAAAECVAALDSVQTGDPVELLLVRALIAWHRDDLDAADRLSAEAQALAGAGASHTARSEALSLEMMMAHATGARRLSNLHQWMAAYAAPSLAALALDPHLCVADYLLASDQPATTVIDFARRVCAATAGTDAVRGEAFATVVLGEAQLAVGDLDEARASLTRSLELHRRVGWVAGEAIALEQLGEAAQLTGDRARADRLLAEALEAARWSPLCSHLLARTHATLIRHRSGAEAVSAVARAERDLADRTLCPVCSARFQLAAAVACAREGELPAARGYLDQVAALGAVTSRGALGAGVCAARAEMALADGNRDSARRGFVDAAGWFADLGHHPAARAWRARAAALRAG